MVQYIKITAAGGGTYYYVGNTAASAYTAFTQQQGKAGTYQVIPYSQFSSGLKGFGLTPPPEGVIAGATKGPAPAPAAPASAAQVQPFLTQSQIATAQKTALPEVRSEEQIRSELAAGGIEAVPIGERPAVPSLKQEYQNLRAEQGVEALESQLNDLKAQEDEIAARLRERTTAQRGQGVALNVVEGRISEITRQEQENLDFVQRQKSRVVDELNMRYNTIQVMMNLTQQDYANALADYNQKFQQNLDVMNLVRDIRQEDKNDVQKAIDNARANLQIYYNLASEGKLDINSLSADQRLAIAKNEIAAGIPVGTIAKIDGRVITMDTLSNGQVQVVTKYPDGHIDIQRLGTPIPKETAPPKFTVTSSVLRTAYGVLDQADVLKNPKHDKYLSRDEFTYAYNKLVSIYGDTDKADMVMDAAWDAGGYQRYQW